MSEPIFKELSRIYGILNTELFDGKLKESNFTLNLKKNQPFRFEPDNLSIVVGKDVLELSQDDLLVNLLHEMVHVYNVVFLDVRDCSSNQYHNKQFMETALTVGLICIRHRNQGWSITTTVYPRNVVDKSAVALPDQSSQTKRSKAFRSARFRRGVLRDFRNSIRQILEDEKPSKTYFLKYVCGCPPPHNSIRSGRRPDGPNQLRIRCEDCGTLFQCMENE